MPVPRHTEHSRPHTARVDSPPRTMPRKLMTNATMSHSRSALHASSFGRPSRKANSRMTETCPSRAAASTAAASRMARSAQRSKAMYSQRKMRIRYGMIMLESGLRPPSPRGAGTMSTGFYTPENVYFADKVPSTISRDLQHAVLGRSEKARRAQRSVSRSRWRIARWILSRMT